VGEDNKQNADGDSWTDIGEVQPDLVEAVPVRHGMVLAGRYAIEKIIGRGGSGVVVRAHDRDLRQVVAIKIVRAELAGQRVWAARLAREVRIARQIHHPNVCRVFDFQQAEGRAFLVMELAEKGTLRDEIRAGGPAARPFAERIADARAVASALDAIHRAGIVHRDLSTQNLLRMGDGRVVLSDFGLAVDVSESTSSVHGGTVAYMAPEVLLGAKASFAADIWALGIVMHEVVFGEKPRWAEVGGTPVMLPPDLGRKPTDEERAALDACRACAVKDPARRLERAEEAGRLLTEPRGWWARQVAPRRPFVYAAVLTVAAAALAGMLGARLRAPDVRPPASANEAPLIVPTGEAVDWTDISTVLVQVPDRIQCTRLLPDQRTIRFLWGTPPRAEDVDIVTAKRSPSSLVPAAYAEGCPDLSPDGKRSVYQGHAKDGRPFAFLSEHPDGRDATPIVPTAEPSMDSEPTWLADGQTFSFDVDAKHMGVFSLRTGRMTVLPDVTAKPSVTSFRSVSPDGVLLSTVYEDGATQFSEISVPALTERARFRVRSAGLDLHSAGSFLYYTGVSVTAFGELARLNVATREAHWLGRLREQTIRYSKVAGGGLTFVGRHTATSIAVKRPDGTAFNWSIGVGVLSAARCGEDLVLAVEHGDRVVIERFSSDGRFLSALSTGPADVSAACSPDGKVLFFVRELVNPGVVRCDSAGCRTIIDHERLSLVASPDGRRLAVVTTTDKRGPIVEITDADGGRRHDLVETETGCGPGWTSNDTLWVSRRHGARIVWTEVDVDSGTETGRSVPGSRDCTDGKPDPLSPASPDVRVVYQQTSQVRFLPKQLLPQQ
jgi:tRNA A-37 threonylcarbamoyl transferase component Bud32